MSEQFCQLSPDGITAYCLGNCERNWSHIDGQIRDIAALEDPLERNRAITGKYRSIAEMNPENRWAKLASYVSAQVGCGMEETDSIGAQTAGRLWVDPGDARQALADGNITIFESVARPFLYTSAYGDESFDHCLEAAPKQPISKELVKAMKMMEEGDLRDAADTIAEYEQVTVVEDVYARHRETFAAIDAFDTSRWDIFNTSRDRQSIPLSYGCTDEDKVPLDGPLSDSKKRVNYYHKLMNELEALEGWNDKAE